MSEPNEPNDADFLADLVHAERERDELPADGIDEAWGALDERIGALTPPPAPPRPPAGRWHTAAKVVGVAAVFGAGVLTGAWLDRSRPPEVPTGSPVASTSSSVARVEPTETTPAPSAVAIAVSSLPVVQAPPVVSVRTASSPSPSAPPVGSTSTQLADERSVVEGARVALLRGRPSDALGLATTHEKRFPSGELAEDRDFIRVRALRDLGRGEEARAHAKAFLLRYPKSGLRGAVAPIAE